MTKALADYLIGLDKFICDGTETLQTYRLDTHFPIDMRLPLTAPDDLDQNLMINIKESAKKTLKISLHHQDNSTQAGVLRVDFNGRHLNPSEINDFVPDSFKPFAGLWLDDYEGHIHYVVDGYKPLAWAIPLEIDDFSVKKLSNRADYMETLLAFFAKINLKTKVSFNHQMSIL